MFGPPVGKRLLLFIDDVNMPRVDTYGTQQPIALLKLLMEREGLYDRTELVWKKFQDIQYIAACGPPGGARNAMDPRFVSLFGVFNITFPKQEALVKVTSSIQLDVDNSDFLHDFDGSLGPFQRRNQGGWEQTHLCYPSTLQQDHFKVATNSVKVSLHL